MFENRITIRGTALALGSALVTVTLSFGMNAWAAEPTTSGRETADGLSGSEADAASVRLGKRAAARQQEKESRPAVRKRTAKRAAAAARDAREAREQRRVSRSAERPSYTGDARAIAADLAAWRYGWTAGQFACLDSLWAKESGWEAQAANPSSGAYGIPQALPGSKMAAYGGDWETNPVTQIEWGLAYIRDSYGSPCSAWETSQAQGWY